MMAVLSATLSAVVAIGTLGLVDGFRIVNVNFWLKLGAMGGGAGGALVGAALTLVLLLGGAGLLAGGVAAGIMN
jgi:hypothetical protein